jgi:hypothetical protein
MKSVLLILIIAVSGVLLAAGCSSASYTGPKTPGLYYNGTREPFPPGDPRGGMDPLTTHGYVEDEPPTASNQRTVAPQLIQQWSARGNQTTGPFTIEDDLWVIAWTFQPDPAQYGVAANAISVVLRKADNSGYRKLIINNANEPSQISNQTYVYDSGTFYLEITSLFGSWAIGAYSIE